MKGDLAVCWTTDSLDHEGWVRPLGLGCGARPVLIDEALLCQPAGWCWGDRVPAEAQLATVALEIALGLEQAWAEIVSSCPCTVT